jgi:hypothetical protein
VAEVKSQLLNHLLVKGGVIQGHIEMSGEYTALSSELRDQVEVVLFVRVFVLHHLSVNDAT